MPLSLYAHRLLKRYGFIPTAQSPVDNMAASFNQGLDAGIVLDSLSNRIKELETHIAAQEERSASMAARGSGSPFRQNSSQQQNNRYRSSVTAPSASLGGGNASSTVRLEESVGDLRVQLRDCEDEVLKLKGAMRTMVKTCKSNGHKRAEQQQQQTTSTNNAGSLSAADSDDIRVLQKRVKRLAENTTKACRSLSGGLSDVQQATLNLYSWSDRAQEAIGTVSLKLGYPVNLCPRAKVYSPPSRDDDRDAYSFLN